jgi:hypothetical protein
MAKKQSGKDKRRAPKTVLWVPDLDQVLNSFRSIDAQRGYRHAIEEFVEWYCSEPPLWFSKTVPQPIALNTRRTRSMPFYRPSLSDVSNVTTCKHVAGDATSLARRRMKNIKRFEPCFRASQ